ncbi:MAG: TetR/AcrR family transcriptional regulator [Deltaproteobacteria bacterium]|nr:MAG: TetR/AcrR family transcriptional regulator [Deltaproteobacteria bacterium]
MAYPSRKEIIQNFRTQSLLEATRGIIATQGFDAVTMERVASEVGITKGGIYLYFRNKDQLILAAIEQIAAEMLREIDEKVENTISPWERLCRVVGRQMEIMERHKELLRTLLLDRRLLKDSPRGRQARLLLKYRERHEHFLSSILDEGRRQRIFPPMETAYAAFFINKMTIAAAEKRLLGLSQLSLEEDTKALLQFIALLLRARPRSTKYRGGRA